MDEKEVVNVVERNKKAQNPENVEFWEDRVSMLEDNRKNILSNLAETEYVLDAMRKKVKLFG